MTAALLGAAGIFMTITDAVREKDTNSKTIAAYFCGACLLSIALWLPHLPITLHQQQELHGLGGWLEKPSPLFFVRYVQYLTHFSLAAFIVLMLCIVLSSTRNKWRSNRSRRTVALSICLLPPLIGYLYSTIVNPVMQYSALLFSYPFLLLALVSGIDSGRGRNVLRCTAGAVLIFTLLFGRQHYKVIDREWIKQAATMFADAQDQYGTNNVICAVKECAELLDYYDTAAHHTLPATVDDDQFAQMLDTAQANYLLTAYLWDSQMATALQHYPYLIKRFCGVSTDVCLLSRIKQPSIEWVSTVVAERDLPTGGRPVTEEYFMLLDTSLSALTTSRFTLLSTQLAFTAADSCTNLKLVIETHIGGKLHDWRCISTNQRPFLTDHGATVELPVKEELNIKSRRDLRRAQIKVYLWNPEQDTLTIPIHVRITTTPTNPYIYAITEPLH